MRKILRLALITIISFSTQTGFSQNCIPTNLNGTTVTYPCNTACQNLRFAVPDLRSDEDYVISNIPYQFYPATSGTEVVSTYDDDLYSESIPLTFPFCFYDSTYNNIIIGSNGIVTFEAICANQDNNYDLDPPIFIPNGAVAAPSGITDRYIPRTAIMAGYMDIDPSITSGSPLRRIEYNVFGSAPCRKFVISFYNVVFFGGTCSNNKMTSQIVLHEGTGLVDIFITEKPVCTGWNNGNAILGIQDYSRTKGVVAPGKNCTNWSETNTGYRFTPSGATSRLISSQITNLAGTVLATGTTSPGATGLVDVNFPNFCPTPFGQYILKTTYDACPTGTTIVSTDTLNLVQSPQLSFTATTTDAACGINNGSITVTVPAGSGVGPYTYILDGGTGQTSNVFPNVSGGPHTVTVTDAAGCTNTITVTVNVISNLAGTITSTGTSCTGVNNGTVTVVPTAGTGPYTFVLTPGPVTNTTGVFTGLTPGSYSVVFTDVNNCNGTSTTTVTAGTTISANPVTTPATCPGVNNGTITVTPTSGVAPYTYTLDGGTPQSSNIFNGVSAGAHTVLVRDNVGCTVTLNVNVTAGSGLTGAIASTPASCPGTPDGTITMTNPFGSSPGTGPYTYSLDGGPSQTSNVFTGVSSGLHTVVFTDVNGCQGTRSINVGGGTAPTTTATSANTSCAGASDGVIVFNPVAGATYTINPGAISNTTGTFTGLGAGTYTLSIATSGGCSGTVTPATVTIAPGAGLSGTATSSAASCPGINNGSITVAPVGTGTTTYTLNPGAVTNTTGIFTGLATGTYTVTFVTAAGCNGTVSPNPVVTANSAPTSTATTSAASCPGASDGTVTVAPAGAGTIYTLNPGAITNATGIFTGLPAGTYTVTFLTSAGCTGTVPVNPVVGAGAAPTTTATAVATTCPGVNNGTITVTPVGAGTTYTLNPGAVTNTTGIFTGLAAGTYTVTFATTAGCSGTVPVNPVVATGPAPTTTATATATSCPGVNDGTVTVATVGAGTTYTLNPGAVTNTTGVFTGLAAGTYTVTFATTAGCSGTVPVNPVVATGPAPTTTATATATSCPGVNDGTITVATVGAGTSYTLNPGAISNTTGVFTGLAAGTYTITFATTAGCNGTVPVSPVVTTGPAVVGTATATSTSCPTVNNGTITVTAPTGPGTTYTLNPGAITNTTGIFTGLAPNTYTISFVTAAGCTGTVTPNTVVTAGPALTSTVAQTNPVCANINDGVISITPQPGTTAPYTATLTGPGGPYTYTGAAPIVFSNLAPGTYNYSYGEAGGCAGTGGPVTLVTNAPILTPAALTNLSCNNSANGSVTFNPVGGVAPYQFSANAGGTYQASGTFSGLSAGPHTFRIRDNVGCIKDTTITLTQPTLLTAAISGTTPAGCSNNDGTIAVTAGGGTAPYSYTITGPVVNTSGTATGTFTALANGSYTITVTDAQGCTRTATGTVGLTDNMFLTLGPDVTICAEASVTFDPQTNPETNIFTWTGINGTATSTIANPSVKNAVARPLDTATYVLHAQWGGCERWDTIVVNVLRKPVANAGQDTAICDNTYAILRGSSSNLSGTVNYAWTGAGNIEFPSQAVTRVYPPGNDQVFTYTLTITDNYGCNFSVTDKVDVRVQPPVPAYAGNDTTAVSGMPHQLFASGGDDYLWSPAGPLNNATAQNPLATLTGDQKFIVRVTDFAGCIGYDTVFVKVYAGPAYYIPNAFTPNGDGLNDVFRPVPAGIARTEYFRIFNRFGETIFETNQYMKGWDGTYKGKKQPIGAYVWVIKGIDRNGKPVEMKGTVMLVQ